MSALCSYSSNRVKSIYSGESEQLCKMCNAGNLTVINGSLICRECGVNNGLALDDGAEWRFYGGSDNKNRTDPTRCGNVVDPFLPNKSTRLYIFSSNKACTYLKKLHTHSGSNYAEDRLLFIFNKFKAIFEENGVPMKILNSCKQMYKTVYPMKLIRGKNVDSQLMAIIYYACKNAGQIYTVKEILDMMNRHNFASLKFKHRNYERICDKCGRKTNALEIVSLKLKKNDCGVCRKYLNSKEFKGLLKDFPKCLKTKEFSNGVKLFMRYYFIHDNRNIRLFKITTPTQYIEKYSKIYGVEHLRDEIEKLVDFMDCIGATTGNKILSTVLTAIFFVGKLNGRFKDKIDFMEICENVSESTIMKVYKDFSRYYHLMEYIAKPEQEPEEPLSESDSDEEYDSDDESSFDSYSF